MYMEKKISKVTIGKLFLVLFFFMGIILPLLRMLMNINRESILKIIHSEGIGTVIINSVVSATAATIIAVVLAYIATVCLERIENRFKGIFSLLFIFPMLVPSISHGMGLIILFGNNGILTRLLHLPGNIYGLRGIIAGAVLYAFPVAFLMESDIMEYEDGSPYEAAEVLGISKFHQFWAITFPYLKKPLISVLFAVFTLVITDYGVPVMVGGKCNTIASVMYSEVTGQLDFGKGAGYGCLLLLPAGIAFLFDLFTKENESLGYAIRPVEPKRTFGTKLFSFAFCSIVSILVLLPVLSFCVLGFTKNYPGNLSITFANIGKAIDLKAGQYLINSIEIALSVSLLGVAISFVNAYLTARMDSGISGMLHLISILSAAVPGIVLGLSYVLVFKGSVLYGTIVILVMVNLVHFLSSPYLMVYNSLSKMNCNLESVGYTLGISRRRMIWDVFIPQSRGTLLEAFAYFFVNCMMTISAVSFLSNTANKPVALMINQFEAQMQLDLAAIVSLAILTVNLCVKGIIHICKTHFC